MGTRWYVIGKSAEGDKWFPIELSESELKTVQKLIEAQFTAIGTPFSGTIYLLGESFGTKEEADAYICENFLD